MSIVNSDLNTLLQTLKNMQNAKNSTEATKSSIAIKYQNLGSCWNDKKYKDLGDVVNDCLKSLNIILKTLLQGEKYVLLLVKSLQEYEGVNFLEGNANSEVHATSNTDPRHLSEDEINSLWQKAVTNTDELIKTYRTEMIVHGAFDGALLTKFLAIQRNRMLQYESNVISAANGQRPPLNDEEIYQYVIVGDGSPYTYDNLVSDFGDFCVKDVSSWVNKINPNPNNDPRRNINCGQCAAAVYRRMNGDNNATAGLGTYSIDEMNEITGRTQTAMSPEEISEYLRGQGAGAHVVVGVDRSSGYGHWFNAFYDGRNIYTIEGQGGCLSGWPPDYGDVVHWDASI